MSILIFIIILVVLILVHEFGHFITAKWMKMRVDEFGVGFPPKAWGYKPKESETEYTFNWLPFGGFVKIFGEDPDNEEALTDERSFVNRPKWAQALVIFAGVAFNVLFAWILISVGFMSGLPTPVSSAPEGQQVENAQLVITAVQGNSPAEESGLRAGDAIVALTTSDEALQDPTPEAVSSFITDNSSKEIEVSYKRGDARDTTLVQPTEGILDDRVAIGITMDMIGVLSLPPHLAAWEGAKTTAFLTKATAVGFYDLIANSIRGSGPGLGAVAGPVGIVGLVGDASDFGFIYLLGFTAFISINLAIINLIPFPALDGGRLLFLGIETIKRSRIKPAVANTANAIGFIILIGLMIAVTYNDIMRIVGS